MATTQVETVSSTADKAKLAGAAILVVAALVAFYLLGKQGPIVQWLALLAGLTAAAVVFFISESGRQLIAFGRETWREVKKVVWPARKEAMQLTGVVFAFVLVMALFLWLTDKTLEWVFYDLILGWRK
jgi:preprotein translocase subunit SecE